MELADVERWLTRVGVDVFYASDCKVLGYAPLRTWGVVANIQVTHSMLYVRYLWGELDREGVAQGISMEGMDFVRFSDFVLRAMTYPAPPRVGTRQGFLRLLKAREDTDGYMYRGVKFAFKGTEHDMRMKVMSPDVDRDIVKGEALPTDFYRRCFEYLWEVAHA